MASMGLNKVILIGNLGADPEQRFTTNGTPVTTMRMATSEVYTDKDGNQQQRTEWHRVVCWGKLAKICGRYLAKGRQIYVEGKFRTRQWEDQQGVTRYTTKVVASRVMFLGGNGRTTQANTQAERAAASQASQPPPGRRHSLLGRQASPASGGGVRRRFFIKKG